MCEVFGGFTDINTVEVNASLKSLSFMSEKVFYHRVPYDPF